MSSSCSACRTIELHIGQNGSLIGEHTITAEHVEHENDGCPSNVVITWDLVSAVGREEDIATAAIETVLKMEECFRGSVEAKRAYNAWPAGRPSPS